MEPEIKPLFVRVAASEAERLDRAAASTGQSKRRLVEDAVRSYLPDDGLVVGKAALSEVPPEVLTQSEAAAFLRVDADELREAAERGEVPARRIGSEWRFSRPALIDWLAATERREGDHLPAPGDPEGPS